MEKVYNIDAILLDETKTKEEKEQAFVARLRTWFRDEYSWAVNEDGSVALEVYVDYNDEAAWESMDWGKYKSLQDFYESSVMDSVYDQEYETLAYVVADELEGNLTEVEEDWLFEYGVDLVQFIMDWGIAYGQYPLQRMLERVEIDVVNVAAKDSQYLEDNMFDYNHFIDFMTNDRNNVEEKQEETEYLKDETWLKELIESQGRDFNVFIEELGKEGPYEDKFLQSIYEEIINSYSYNSIVFLESITLGEYFEKLESKEPVTISKHSMTGLVDIVNGGGSILEIALEKDVTIPRENLLIFADGEYRYSIKDTYGMSSFR